MNFAHLHYSLTNCITHWGRVTHICVSKLTIIGSNNGLSPGWRQAIIRTNAGILLIEPLGTNFSENVIEIYTFSLKKMHLKMSSGKWRPFCLGLNVLTIHPVTACNWYENHVALNFLKSNPISFIWQEALTCWQRGKMERACSMASNEVTE